MKKYKKKKNQTRALVKNKRANPASSSTKAHGQTKAIGVWYGIHFPDLSRYSFSLLYLRLAGQTRQKRALALSKNEKSAGEVWVVRRNDRSITIKKKVTRVTIITSWIVKGYWPASWYCIREENKSIYH